MINAPAAVQDELESHPCPSPVYLDPQAIYQAIFKHMDWRRNTRVLDRTCAIDEATASLLTGAVKEERPLDP